MHHIGTGIRNYAYIEFSSYNISHLVNVLSTAIAIVLSVHTKIYIHAYESLSTHLLVCAQK